VARELWVILLSQKKWTHILSKFNSIQVNSTFIMLVSHQKHYKTELEFESNISTSEKPSSRESMSTAGNGAAALSSITMTGAGAGVGASVSDGVSTGAGVGIGGEKKAAGPRSGGEKKDAAPGAAGGGCACTGGACALIVLTTVAVALIVTAGTASCCTGTGSGNWGTLEEEFAVIIGATAKGVCPTDGAYGKGTGRGFWTYGVGTNTAGGG
jgi:hypothetical protein